MTKILGVITTILGIDCKWSRAYLRTTAPTEDEVRRAHKAGHRIYDTRL